MWLDAPPQQRDHQKDHGHDDADNQRRQHVACALLARRLCRVVVARAVGDVRVLVFHDTELQWVHQHDYRLTYEFESMIRMQRRSIAKQAREQRKRELALKAAEVETGESDKDHSMMRSVSAQPLVGAE